MRVPLVLLASAIVITVVLLVGVQLASAGSAEAPELQDASGDCSVPYGNAYLDITSAWIDGETADAFDVHLRLSSWEDEIAEGSGYTVQFSHQGLTWGIVAVYSSVVSDGWEFSTGVATAELAEGFEDAPGSFDAGTRTITVTFPKRIFPHEDATDTTLEGFVAMSADLRPAYPYFVGEGNGAPVDGNGKWIVCDDATGTGEYAFASGEHSAAHASASAATTEAAPHEEDASSDEAEAPLTTQQSDNDTPLAPFVALAALALAALRRR